MRPDEQQSIDLKLVLLPGMDGTGKLFDGLIAELPELDVLSIPLPQQGPQDYESLCQQLTPQLPREPFVLLAESFSGGIAARLTQAEIPQLAGVIFVASFLSSPRPWLARLAAQLPIKLLARLPCSNMVFRHFFLGTEATEQLSETFRASIHSVPEKVLSTRLAVIAHATPAPLISELPAVYIQAEHDKLVPAQQKELFLQAYPNISILSIPGPHFILQANPRAAAEAVTLSLRRLKPE